MNPRAEILANIRASLRRGALPKESSCVLEKRIVGGPSLIPERATGHCGAISIKSSNTASVRMRSSRTCCCTRAKAQVNTGPLI